MHVSRELGVAMCICHAREFHLQLGADRFHRHVVPGVLASRFGQALLLADQLVAGSGKSFRGFGDLRNQAVAACRFEWIFSLDSDERCTELARDEIQSIIRRGSDAHDIYMVPRKNYFLGRWIKHSGWYPDYRQPQLFRRGCLSGETSLFEKVRVARKTESEDNK